LTPAQSADPVQRLHPILLAQWKSSIECRGAFGAERGRLGQLETVIEFLEAPGTFEIANIDAARSPSA
jgi:hypothetical protein